jgi:hypothetical protein
MAEILDRIFPGCSSEMRCFLDFQRKALCCTNRKEINFGTY